MTGAETLVGIIAAVAAVAGAVVELRRMGHDSTDTRDRLSRLEERVSAQADRIAKLEQQVEAKGDDPKPEPPKARGWWWG